MLRIPHIIDVFILVTIITKLINIVIMGPIDTFPYM
jgi:hypothetical protein